MLETKLAGGGCMTNLGVHFIDMAMYLTDSTDAEVLASSYHYASEYDIETYATSLVKLSSGATLLLESGYAYPMDEIARDNRWNIVTKDGYYTLGDNCFEKRVYGKATERIEMSTDSDVYYPIYTLESLRQYLAGETPKAGLPEMKAVRKILDAMNQKASI
jgi:predicted dehydrogenase